MKNRRVWCLSFAMAALGVAGCGGGAPPLKLADPVPAKGTVTIDEKPLAKALVYFVPEGAKVKGPGSSAITDESGNYELVTVISGKSKFDQA